MKARHCLGLAIALLVAVGACSNQSQPGPVPTLTGDCAPYQAYAGHAGTEVTVSSAIISPESDSLQQSWAQFSSCTGIKIAYEGANDFESQLPVRVAGGNAPDLALIPQPGLLKQMVTQRKAVKPPAQTLANVERYWSPEWKRYGSVDGTFYAAPMSSSMKSLVWYSPQAFRQAGYEVPKTWDELMRLSDTIANAGQGKPWCGGLASGTATGWPATDWLEQVVLRRYGGEVYDKWVNGDIRFTAPEITDSMRTVAGWMQNPRWVNGGFGDVRSIATTTFQEAGRPILAGQCWMLQQSSYYGAQWPVGTTIGPDGDVFGFYLPTIDPAVRDPVVGAGEFVTAFADRPEVQAVQTYLSTPEWAASRVAVAPGWLSANRGVSPSSYQNPLDQLAAKYLTDPNTTFRFDASDLMPAAVGSGQEWRSMTAWFAEGLPIDRVASDINAAWPS